jgi:hypothetical protein
MKPKGIMCQKLIPPSYPISLVKQQRFVPVIRYNAGHEAATVQLRTLFVFCTLAGVVCAWVAYQLNWIRQRHEFIARYGDLPTAWRSDFRVPGVPWQLQLFGERPTGGTVLAPESQAVRARELFPEAAVDSYSDSQGTLDIASRFCTRFYMPPTLEEQIRRAEVAEGRTKPTLRGSSEWSVLNRRRLPNPYVALAPPHCWCTSPLL